MKGKSYVAVQHKILKLIKVQHYKRITKLKDKFKKKQH